MARVIKAARCRARILKAARPPDPARLDAALRDLAKQLARDEAQRAARAEEFYQAVITLSRALTQRLIGDLLEADPRRVEALLAPLLAPLRHATRLSLRGHPADIAQLAARLRTLGLDREGSDIVLQASDELERGSLHLYSDVGDIDGTLSTRLASLLSGLHPEVRGEVCAT